MSIKIRHDTVGALSRVLGGGDFILEKKDEGRWCIKLTDEANRLVIVDLSSETTILAAYEETLQREDYKEITSDRIEEREGHHDAWDHRDVLCPECGETVHCASGSWWDQICPCGYEWRVHIKEIAVGRKKIEP